LRPTLSLFSGERLYGGRFSCDIDYVSNPEEKLAGVDQSLADLGKSDEEISEVRGRFSQSEPADLAAVDDALGSLSDGVTLDTPVAPAPPVVSEAPESDWDHDDTEIEIMDESDFVLLVDEDELDELEKVGEDDAMTTTPPALPDPDGEEGDGFFKKLFGNRRSRPPQP